MLVVQLVHHRNELLEVDLTVIVCIDPADDLVPDGLVGGGVLAEHVGDFGCVDRTAAIFIEKLECCTHILLVHNLVLVDCGSAPLGKVDGARAVGVSVVEDGVGALFDGARILLRVQLEVRVDELGALDQTVAVLIELGEGLAHLGVLLLRGQVRSQIGHSRLDHLRIALYKGK